MFKNKKFFLVSMSVFLLTLALGLAAFAPFETASAAILDDGFNHRPGSGGPDNNQEALAEVLGISVEELKAAQDAVQAEALKQAVADGKLTEEQAALIEAQHALREYVHKETLIANALGITVEELEAANKDGQQLPDLIEALGIEPAYFQANMEAQHEAALAQAIEDGIITQEQADQILEGDFHGMSVREGRGRPGQSGGMERPESLPGRPRSGENQGSNSQGTGQPGSQD